jgi:hypothetical protein
LFEIFHFCFVTFINIKQFFARNEALKTDVPIFLVGEENSRCLMSVTNHLYGFVWVRFACVLSGLLLRGFLGKKCKLIAVQINILITLQQKIVQDVFLR